MSLKSWLLFGALCGVGVGVSGDLRPASQPRAGFAVRQRNPVQFVNQTVIYMEPSDFNYQGLKNQRNGGGYDNFLRSNIDNEQDKRNFNTEAGRDMLPFRSYEGAPTDASRTVQTKIPDGAPLGPALQAPLGQQVLYPLRWNNPHASELEVNIWIMNVPSSPVVVPIRKPTCSGEGHQDNVIAFTVPNNFNTLGNIIPGFTGCQKEGDCVLQVYAHSVEPRTYAIGVPIVVPGPVQQATATTTAGIEKARQDVGLDLSQLTRDVCLSSTSTDADITVAVPRQARLVSDQFNHAYQNSDYSPYSGQQPELISRNLQASSIISMVPGNRGELGKALLQKQGKAAQVAANLRNQVKNLVQKYEGLTNNIIAKLGNSMKNTATEGANGVQKLANCFRCAEVGSTTTTRQTTNTYVPSFQLPDAKTIAAAKALVPAKYAGLISASGVVQIYQAVLNDMSAQFAKAAKENGLTYQPAVVKLTMTTMEDKTDFKKINAQGQKDNGVYAAQQAQITKEKAANAVSQRIVVGDSPLMATLSAEEDLPDSFTPASVPMVDDDGIFYDSKCDDDLNPTEECEPPSAMFASAGDGVLNPVDESSSGQQTKTTLNVGVIAGIAAGAGVLILIITAAIVKYHRNKHTTVTAATSTTTSRV